MENSFRPVSGAFHYAIATGDTNTVQSLLREGIDADIPLCIKEEELKRLSQLSISSSCQGKNVASSITNQISGHVMENNIPENVSGQEQSNTQAGDPTIAFKFSKILGDENRYAMMRNDNNELLASLLIAVKTDETNHGKATSVDKNNRRSIVEMIDEKLCDENKTLIERSSSIRRSKMNNKSYEEILKDEKSLKCMPRIRRTISSRWSRKGSKKRGNVDDEEYYKNIIITKARNVDNEQLNENYEGLALFEAVSEGMDIIVQTLLETSNDCQINLTDENGFSPAMQAAWHGQKDCLKILLDHGANTSLKNATGCTAAHFAAGQGHFECLELLIDDGRIDVNATTKFGATALILAAKVGHQKAVKLLLKNSADPNIKYRGNQNALLFAAGNGHYECLQALLGYGVQIDQQNSQKVTPLMRAVQQGHNPCVVLLIDNGADMDKRDSIGRSAIHFAVEFNNPKALEILLNAGAHGELETKGGSTPLAYAERFQNTKCEDMLKKHLTVLEEKSVPEKDVPNTIEEAQVCCFTLRMYFGRTKS